DGARAWFATSVVAAPAIAIPALRLLDAQVVLDVRHAGQGVDAIFGAALLLTARNGAVERHLTVADGDRYLPRVDAPVLCERVAGVFHDSLVRPGVTRRPMPAVAALFAVIVIIAAKP